MSSTRQYTDAEQLALHRKVTLIQRIFITTADQNYIVARWSALNGFGLDFYWLGLHAVEKYLKAIILLNGGTVKHSGHNIQNLSIAALGLHPDLQWGELKQQIFSGPEESTLKFIERLNAHGAADNRYLGYGYIFAPDDLFKLDQLVFSVRRHSRQFKQRVKCKGDTKEIDWVQRLQVNPGEWRLSNTFPIEKSFDKQGTEANAALRKFNVPFGELPGRFAPHLVSVALLCSIFITMQKNRSTMISVRPPGSRLNGRLRASKCPPSMLRTSRKF